MTRNRTFKIVAAGEDFAAVRQVQELAKRLAAELEPEIAISSKVLNFEVLDKAQVREEAAREAVEANMIIVAGNGITEPPTYVKRWFNSWLPRKRNGVTALVALIHHEYGVRSELIPLCIYLRQLADKWGMDFFSNSEEWCSQFLECTDRSPRRLPEIPQFKPGGTFQRDYAWNDRALLNDRALDE